MSEDDSESYASADEGPYHDSEARKSLDIPPLPPSQTGLQPSATDVKPISVLDDVINDQNVDTLLLSNNETAKPSITEHTVHESTIVVAPHTTLNDHKTTATPETVQSNVALGAEKTARTTVERRTKKKRTTKKKTVQTEASVNSITSNIATMPSPSEEVSNAQADDSSSKGRGTVLTKRGTDKQSKATCDDHLLKSKSESTTQHVANKGDSSIQSQDAEISRSFNCNSDADSTTLDQTVDPLKWGSDLLSSAATHMARGVGDGMHNLADALGIVLGMADTESQHATQIASDRGNASDGWDDDWGSSWSDKIDLPTEYQPEEHSSSTTPSNVPPVENFNQAKKMGPKAGVIDPTSTALDRSGDTTPGNETSTPASGWNWAGALAHQLGTTLQSTSLNLVQSGVSVLETIGRKTMSVIQENDPGFQYTKKLLNPAIIREQKSLSQLLREAHETQLSQSTSSPDTAEARKGDFNHQLEASRALVHLEALELVSERAETQLHGRLELFETTGLKPGDSRKKQRLISQLTIRDGLLDSIAIALQFTSEEESNTARESDNSEDESLFVAPEEQVGIAKPESRHWTALRTSLSKLNSIYSGDNLLQTFTTHFKAITALSHDLTLEDVFNAAIGALADVTSSDLEYLHKLAECVLVRSHLEGDEFGKVAATVALVLRLSARMKSCLCQRYINIIKKAPKPAPSDNNVAVTSCATLVRRPTASQLIANLLLECGNAQSYLSDAARLLVPVFQLACVNSILDDKPDINTARRLH